MIIHPFTAGTTSHFHHMEVSADCNSSCSSFDITNDKSSKSFHRHHPVDTVKQNHVRFCPFVTLIFYKEEEHEKNSLVSTNRYRYENDDGDVDMVQLLQRSPPSTTTAARAAEQEPLESGLWYTAEDYENFQMDVVQESKKMRTKHTIEAMKPNRIITYSYAQVIDCVMKACITTTTTTTDGIHSGHDEEMDDSVSSSSFILPLKYEKLLLESLYHAPELIALYKFCHKNIIQDKMIRRKNMIQAIQQIQQQQKNNDDRMMKNPIATVTRVRDSNDDDKEENQLLIAQICCSYSLNSRQIAEVMGRVAAQVKL